MNNDRSLGRALIALGAFIIAVALIVALAGCGSDNSTRTISYVPNAYQFCQHHGGVNEASWQSDGSVLCNDGSLYVQPHRNLLLAGFFLHHARTLHPPIRRSTRFVVRRRPPIRPIQRRVVVRSSSRSSSSRPSSSSSFRSSSSRSSSSSSSGRRR